MAANNLAEVLSFAIEKEEEAMAFYTSLASRVTSGEIAAELKRIAEMERGHRDKLRKVSPQKLVSAKAQKTPANLQIAEYLVPTQPAPEMGWQEVIAVAMQRELASMRLYQDLAALADDAASKQLFLALSKEEAEHKNYFEREWDENVLKEN